MKNQIASLRKATTRIAEAIEKLEAVIHAKPDQSYSLAGAARLAGVNAYTLRDHVTAGRVEPPSVLPGRTLPRYSPEQVERIKAYFGSAHCTLPLKTHWRKAVQASGYWTSHRLCEVAGISSTTLIWHQKRGNLPKPTHKQPGAPVLLYNDAEAKKIIAWLRARKLARAERLIKEAKA